jgi:hypothetical protein
VGVGGARPRGMERRREGGDGGQLRGCAKKLAEALHCLGQHALLVVLAIQLSDSSAVRPAIK